MELKNGLVLFKNEQTPTKEKRFGKSYSISKRTYRRHEEKSWIDSSAKFKPETTASTKKRKAHYCIQSAYRPSTSKYVRKRKTRRILSCTFDQSSEKKTRKFGSDSAFIRTVKSRSKSFQAAAKNAKHEVDGLRHMIGVEGHQEIRLKNSLRTLTDSYPVSLQLKESITKKNFDSFNLKKRNEFFSLKKEDDMEKMMMLLKKKNHLIKMIELENEKNRRGKELKVELHKGLLEMKKQRDNMFKNLKRKNEVCVNLEGKIRHLGIVELNYKQRIASVDIGDEDMMLI